MIGLKKTWQNRVGGSGNEMGTMQVGEVVARMHELERQFVGLRQAWEAAFEAGISWRDLTNDYDAYRTFVLAVGLEENE